MIGRLHSILVLIILLSSGGAVELQPNARWEVPMPELGDTEDGGKGRVGIRLPTDFDPKRRYPAIIAFGGGAGGSNPDQLHQIIGGTGFIVVAVPYKKGLIWGSPLSWYMPMLERAFAEVPNINREILVSAGFSSGGGATGRMTFNKEGMDLFCAAIPAGLNPFPAPPGAPCFQVIDHPRFVGFPILAIIGSEDKTRITDMRRFRDAAKATKVDLTYIEMAGVGHTWDKSSWPQVRSFLREKVIDRQRGLALAAMDAALAAKKARTVLDRARTVLDLCSDDHPDAARAHQALAQVGIQAEAAYKALPGQATPKALTDFAAAWPGTPWASQAIERYEALAAAVVQSVEPEATATSYAVEQWVKAGAAFIRKWPDTAAARQVQGAVEGRLDRDLESILAKPMDVKQRRVLAVFAKTFAEWPAGQRAQADLRRVDTDAKRPAKP